MRMRVLALYIVLVTVSNAMTNLDDQVSTGALLKEEFCLSKECHSLKENMKCWGYEQDCATEKKYDHVICDRAQEEPSDRRSIEQLRESFWTQADFGYVKSLMDSMVDICEPQEEGDSILRCVGGDKYCYAKHLYMDFRKVSFTGSTSRFSFRVLKTGNIGGHCRVNQIVHAQQEDKRGSLSGDLHSWYAEVGTYSSLNFKVKEGPHCDEYIEEPTWIMKLDAGNNIFHHFCDFFNLYVSQHVNGSFSTEARILMWDTSELRYEDYCPEVWSAFTKYPIRRINEFVGRRVCFREAIFSLLPRTVGGLFYNSWISAKSCYGSNLFKAFSEYILSHLQVRRHISDKLRVTFLSRNTQHRNVLNEQELVDEMRKYQSIDVQLVQFVSGKLSFREQMQIIRDTDIFIGIHGAGLTHLLFLPDGAAVFELYNTEDTHCYKDLARLRGVRYFTWEDRSKIYPTNPNVENPKMTDYHIDVQEFMRKFRQCVEHVLNYKRID